MRSLTTFFAASLATAATLPLAPEAIIAKRQESMVPGVALGEMIHSIKEYLKDDNAYDPDVPDKCVLETWTENGGNCRTTVDCYGGKKNIDKMPTWSQCFLHGRQLFDHPLLGKFSITMDKAGGKEGNTWDGLHNPIFQFEALNNWEKLDVQKVIDGQGEDSEHGNLCKYEKNSATQQLSWKCGIPQLKKSAVSAYGIDLVPKNAAKKGFKPGWCTARVIQYQKGEYGHGPRFTFTVQVMDAAGDQIGEIQQKMVDEHNHLQVASNLPYLLTIDVTAYDKDPVKFCYASTCWSCDGTKNTAKTGHYCTLGHAKNGGYEHGDRKGEFGFTC